MHGDSQVGKRRTCTGRTTHGQGLVQHAVSHCTVVREAEFYGLVRGTSIGIGIRGLMQDLGANFRVRTNTDSSAAFAISKRRGFGNVRHIGLNQIWIRHKVISGGIEVRKATWGWQHSRCISQSCRPEAGRASHGVDRTESRSRTSSISARDIEMT